ncbi:MAG: hypothetical protein FJW14_00680 [Acidimicrobiia bacterium]|nr:hypothetical protein [Acidimicrobiia bacterium]
MQVDPDFPVRRRVRLPQRVYSEPGAFFVTICTWRRACVLGEIVDYTVRPGAYGAVVDACWREIPAHFAGVQLDACVVMPNHLHGIVKIVGGGLRATHASPLRRMRGSLLPVPMLERGSMLPAAPLRRPPSLGTIVGSFKSAVTRRVHDGLRATPASPLPRIDTPARPRRPPPFWQRGYYDHVIRDEAALLRLRQYILDNPARWAEDPDNVTR